MPGVVHIGSGTDPGQMKKLQLRGWGCALATQSHPGSWAYSQHRALWLLAPGGGLPEGLKLTSTCGTRGAPLSPALPGIGGDPSPAVAGHCLEAWGGVVHLWALFPSSILGQAGLPEK